VLRPHRIGASTLAALAVAPERLDAVAALVSEYPEVNHNYQREHRYNLWFVVTAADRARLDAVLGDIGRRSGLKVLDLPMLEDYFIDLGFRLQWT
jgi:DNA-binding Lrp family transcriptional regulator